VDLKISLIFFYENVGRAAISERVVLDLQRRERRTPMKILVSKALKFVERVW